MTPDVRPTPSVTLDAGNGLPVHSDVTPARAVFPHNAPGNVQGIFGEGSGIGAFFCSP